MIFASVPPLEAEGGVVAYRVRAGGEAFAKGQRLSAEDCAVLSSAGVTQITIAREEPGDVGENEAARRLGQAALGEGLRAAEPFTGRVNLFAEADGVLLVDAGAIQRFNALDEGMTIATLPPFRRVRAGEMIATVKIIPFALPGMLVDAGLAIFSIGKPLTVAPFQPRRVGLIQLSLPETKPSVLAKTAKVTAERLAALGSALAFEQRFAHQEDTLVEALSALNPDQFDILLIFGAAAISDRRDVIPRAIERSGGQIEHLGMPVDPGNLLLIGECHAKPVIGAPGCARSPIENGFDWVLQRLSAGLTVTSGDIRAMGVGGLLMEIGTRPQPRAGHSSTEPA
ncbi:MAG: molybdopterin-binding protein [Rhizobiales bacterium]|nr:molybdopterin-binding protein [Hyphomicrobiales bacterium]